MKLFIYVIFPCVVVVIATAIFLFWGEEIADAVARISPGCLSRKFLHLSCPGCGGTRAFCALARGHVAEAIRYNFWWLPSTAIILEEYCFFCLRKFSLTKILLATVKGFRIYLLYTYAAGTVIYTIARNVLDF